MKLNSLVILFLTISLLSCKLIDTTELDVQTYPSSRDQIVMETATLWISFSEKLIQSEAEEFLQVTGPSGIIEGDKVWDGTTLKFSPYEPLTTGHRYKFLFKGEVETTSGLKFTVDKNFPFFAGTDTGKGILTDYTPESGTVTSVLQPLQFTFSKSINIQKFEDNFSVSPSADVNYQWSNNNKTVVVSPVKKWSNKKLHRWKIPTSVLDSTDIPIAMEYSKTFLVQEDTLSPTLDLICPAIEETDGTFTPLTVAPLTELDNSNDIYMVFSEAIDFTSLNSSFSVKPDLDGVLKQLTPDTFVYYRSRSGTNFVPEQEYEITLKKGLKDISGNSIPEDIVMKFITNVQPIKVEQITISQPVPNPDINFTAIQLNSNELMGQQNLKYFGSSDYRLTFIIKLSTGFAVDEVSKRLRFLSTISCETVFPDTTTVTSPGLYHSVWNDTGDTLTIQFNSFTKTTPDKPIYYKFNIAGGNSSVSNKSGSYLLENVYFYFNAEGAIE